MTTSNRIPVLTPQGHLVLAPTDEARTLPDNLQERLEVAFERGAGHGLLELGIREVGTALPAEFAYWRDFAGRYVTMLCTTAQPAGATSAVAVSAVETAKTDARVSDRRMRVPMKPPSVNLSLQARDSFGNGGTFLVRLVSKHRSVDDIADGVDIRHVGLPVTTDCDAALVGERYARFFERVHQLGHRRFGVGRAGGNMDDIAGEEAGAAEVRKDQRARFCTSAAERSTTTRLPISSRWLGLRRCANVGPMTRTRPGCFVVARPPETPRHRASRAGC